MVSLVESRWSLGALRRAGDGVSVACCGGAALAGPLYAGGAFDALCELSRSRGLGHGARESAGGVAAVVSGAKVESAAAGAKVETAAAADDVVAAAVAWVAEAGTASVLEQAVPEGAWRGAIAWDLAGGDAAASSSRAALVAPRFGSGLCCCCCSRLVRGSCCDMDACATATKGCCWFEQSARPALCC